MRLREFAGNKFSRIAQDMFLCLRRANGRILLVCNHWHNALRRGHKQAMRVVCFPSPKERLRNKFKILGWEAPILQGAKSQCILVICRVFATQPYGMITLPECEVIFESFLNV